MEACDTCVAGMDEHGSVSLDDLATQFLAGGLSVAKETSILRELVDEGIDRITFMDFVHHLPLYVMTSHPCPPPPPVRHDITLFVHHLPLYVIVSCPLSTTCGSPCMSDRTFVADHF